MILGFTSASVTEEMLSRNQTAKAFWILLGRPRLLSGKTRRAFLRGERQREAGPAARSRFISCARHAPREATPASAFAASPQFFFSWAMCLLMASQRDFMPWSSRQRVPM